MFSIILSFLISFPFTFSFEIPSEGIYTSFEFKNSLTETYIFKSTSSHNNYFEIESSIIDTDNDRIKYSIAVESVKDTPTYQNDSSLEFISNTFENGMNHLVIKYPDSFNDQILVHISLIEEYLIEDIDYCKIMFNYRAYQSLNDIPKYEYNSTLYAENKLGKISVFINKLDISQLNDIYSISYQVFLFAIDESKTQINSISPRSYLNTINVASELIYNNLSMINVIKQDEKEKIVNARIHIIYSNKTEQFLLYDYTYLEYYKEPIIIEQAKFHSELFMVNYNYTLSYYLNNELMYNNYYIEVLNPLVNFNCKFNNSEIEPSLLTFEKNINNNILYITIKNLDTVPHDILVTFRITEDNYKKNQRLTLKFRTYENKYSRPRIYVDNNNITGTFTSKRLIVHFKTISFNSAREKIPVYYFYLYRIGDEHPYSTDIKAMDEHNWVFKEERPMPFSSEQNEESFSLSNKLDNIKDETLGLIMVVSKEIEDLRDKNVIEECREIYNEVIIKRETEYTFGSLLLITLKWFGIGSAVVIVLIIIGFTIDYFIAKKRKKDAEKKQDNSMQIGLV